MGMRPTTQAPSGLVEKIEDSDLDKILSLLPYVPTMVQLSNQLTNFEGVDLTSLNHNSLLNRNAVDAHPISAIDGLAEILATIPPAYNDTYLVAAITDLQLNKVSASVGLGLSQNSFTDAYKAQLDNLNTLLAGKANVSHTHSQSDIDGLSSTLANKQDSLVSGVSIKTINGVSVLGSGDIVISGGGSSDHSTLTNRNIADAHHMSAITGLTTVLAGKSDTTHTHSYGIVDISGLSTALAGKSDTGHTHSVATTSVDGFMSAADKTKLNGIATGATANTGTVTSVSGSGTVSGLTLSGTVTGSGNITLGGTLAVTPSNFSSQAANLFLASPNGASGVPTFRSIVAADIPILNQNTTGSAGSVAWANVTGKPSNATTSVDGFMSATDKTKLDSVASGATVNATDAALRDRSTHTGTQATSTITGLDATLASKATPADITAALVGYVKIHVGTTPPADTTMLWLDTN